MRKATGNSALKSQSEIDVTSKITVKSNLIFLGRPLQADGIPVPSDPSDHLDTRCRNINLTLKIPNTS